MNSSAKVLFFYDIAKKTKEKWCALAISFD